MRAHDHLRGETGPQALRCAIQSDQHLVLETPRSIREMNVTIDQPRQHGRLAQVNDLCSSRSLDTVGWTYFSNSVATDKYYLIAQICPGLRVKQPARAHSYNLRVLRRQHGRSAQNQKNQAQNMSKSSHHRAPY